MKILDEKDQVITDPDLEQGYLLPERILLTHHEAIAAIPEQGHEVITEYPETGGRDIAWVVDVPAAEAVDAWDEYEDILRYKRYSAQELAQRKIEQLKQKLEDTDYITAKAIDLAVCADSIGTLLNAFAQIHAQYKDTFLSRAQWRAQINELENQ